MGVSHEWREDKGGLGCFIASAETGGPAECSIGFQPVRADRSMSHALVYRRRLWTVSRRRRIEQDTGWKPMLLYITHLDFRAKTGLNPRYLRYLRAGRKSKKARMGSEIAFCAALDRRDNLG